MKETLRRSAAVSLACRRSASLTRESHRMARLRSDWISLLRLKSDLSSSIPWNFSRLRSAAIFRLCLFLFFIENPLGVIYSP